MGIGKELDAVLSGSEERMLSPTSPAQMWQLEKLMGELDKSLPPDFRLNLIASGYTPHHTELRKEIGNFILYYAQGKENKYELSAILRK